MNGEKLTTNTSTPIENKPETTPEVEAPEAEFESFSGELRPRAVGYGENVSARLSPEPLSKEHKDELLKLSSSDTPEDVYAFVERKADLTPEQQHEFDEHRENVHLLQMQETNPESFARQITALPEDRRNAFYEFERQTKAENTAKAREVVAQKQANPETDDDFLLLHSLKLTEPERFKEVFNGLKPAQKGEFDAFEAREDARVKAAAPELNVPKLSVDGETWMTPTPAPKPEATAASIVDAAPDEPYQSAQEMRTAGQVEYQQHREFVDSVTVPQKPSRWAQIRGLFSRKPKA